MTAQPHWFDDPGRLPTKTRHKLLRCPPVRLKPYVILSDRLLFIGVHWQHRRSIPCEGIEKCDLCQKQHPTFKGYLCVYDPANGERYCLEVTPPTFEPIGAYRTLYQTLRGAAISLTRAGTKENGRMTARLDPSGIPASQLPEAIDVQEVMEELWDKPDKTDSRKMTSPRDAIGGEQSIDALRQHLNSKGVPPQCQKSPSSPPHSSPSSAPRPQLHHAAQERTA